MIVLDTCTAINCFNISKLWIKNLIKQCPDRTILWETKPDQELYGLQNKNKKFIDFRQKLHDSEHVKIFDIEDDLSDEEYELYLECLQNINEKDGALLLKDLFNQNQNMNLSDLQTNGKKRLSDTDKELIALALAKDNTILASDDNRILTIIEDYFNTQPYCCSIKIIKLSNNIDCFHTLKETFNKKDIKFYSRRYNTNKLNICS